MKISREFSVGLGKEFSLEWRKRFILCLGATLFLVVAPPCSLSQQNQPAPAPLELSRTVRPWEFLPVTGTRAALFGNETGTMEAWVYPLKIFRGFHLNFLTDGEVLAAETLFVPVDTQGAVIVFDVQTEQPLEIQALFHRDFQLEWPAALAATYLD